MNFLNIFKKLTLSKENIATLLNTSPELLTEFENAYSNVVEENKIKPDKDEININADFEQLIKTENRIVQELLLPINEITEPVTNEDLQKIPKELRPQLTGTLMRIDIKQPAYIALLFNWQKWKETNDKQFYHMFRQGLDILDLDPITYEMLGMNPNNMSHWFPTLKKACESQSFFKIPETKIVKVPMPILQLTRLDYFSLTSSTFNIVNRWAKSIFALDENKTYFVKTGTHSDKFDFRNAKITTPKEVNDIGQYLLYIHSKAINMAQFDLSGQHKPCIYGVSTTNEWIVREYIEDKENLPCIYHGLPLHTEYRAFIDFDTDEILGIFPYWDSETMKRRFSECSDADTPDMTHDYIIYCKEEERLQKTFDANVDMVKTKLQSIISDIDLPGQWSLDIMQNADDFWIIDMAIASASALAEKLTTPIKTFEENWLPDLSRKE